MERYTLRKYLELLEEEGLVEYSSLRDAGGAELVHLTYASGHAVPGTLFLCKGAAFKEEYLMEAIQRGATAYVSEQRYEACGQVPHIIVNNMRKAMAVLSKKFYGAPDERLKVVGVTGTKGKTTTAYYIKAILDAYQRDQGRQPSGLISTIETYDGCRCQESRLTTPESPELFGHFRNAADSGLQYMTMEVSSQALKYQRVRKITFDVGVFLNISEDHISPAEHQDFEDYFSSKLSIFRQTGTACVNLDSDHAQQVLKAARMAGHIVTFGTKGEPDILGRDVRMQQGHLSFEVVCKEFTRRFELAMHGLFNVENALAAIAAAYSMGIPAEYMERGLAQARVRGRMEQYCSADGKVAAIVDFAHNRLSFEKLFDSVMLEYPGWRLVSIFGCPGGKAYNRRRDLGLIAGLYSQKLYLVADDPGTEAPMEISREIGRYAEIVGCPYECIEDRGQAIRKAIHEATEKTVILVLGKGSEAWQKYGRISYPCPADGEYVEQGMQEYDKRNCRKNAVAV